MRRVFLALLLCVASVAARTVVPFSYAWRFKFGFEAGSGLGPNTCTNFHNITTYSCTNMERNPNRFTPSDCGRACCYDRTCTVWQNEGKTCYHGGADAVCTDTGKSQFTDAGQRPTVLPVRTDYHSAATDFDDSDWDIVDAPHDALMSPDNEFADNSVDVFHGFRNRNVSWYRKHFTPPSSLKGKSIWLQFDGVFHFAQLYLNGNLVATHTAGYTGFTVRLDNITSLAYDASNVLAVRADASYGSGHWYEGGGIYRDVWLVAADPVHIVADGAFVSSETDGTTPVIASAEVENHGSSATSVKVMFALMDNAGKQVASTTTDAMSVGTSGTTLFNTTLDLSSTGVSLWSVQNPVMYTVKVTVMDASSSSSLDALTVPAGFRTTKWSAQSGFYLNNKAVDYRGFSHHNSMSGLGVALPQRVWLFRGQATRALGGNFWRCSHNPYTPMLYPVLNTLGIMAWDENRDYGPWYVQEMHDMVKRDRNNPAILMWAFCNEFECGQNSNQTGLLFRKAALSVDPTRPLAANGNSNGPATSGIDIQGFSHKGNSSFISFHGDYPDVPLVLSECCSCTSQRADRDVPGCIGTQNSPGLLPYVAGSLGVWTLSDYFGESHTWPQVSSPYGQFDIAGFPKPHAAWYRTNWLQRMDDGRPPLPTTPLAHITTLLDQPFSEISGITTTDMAALIADGKSLGIKQGTAGVPFTWTPGAPTPTCDFSVNVTGVQCHGLKKNPALDAASCEAACCKEKQTCSVWQYASDEGCWIGQAPLSSCTSNPDWVGGAAASLSVKNATLVALDHNGAAVAHHQVLFPDTQSALAFTIDVPSPSTGTGSALVLDGSDIAFLRVSTVDKNGVLATASAVNVTFSIVSGAGRVLGVGNGDPALQVQPHSMMTPTYLGLARVIVQVTSDCMSENLDLVSTIDNDGNKRTAIHPDGCTATPIVVKASAPGLTAATVSVTTSVSSKDAPLEVAAANVDLNTWTYTQDFQG